MKQLLYFLFISLPFSCYAQYFSGEIEYKIHIVPKKEGVDVDSLMALQSGDMAKYRITSNFYKSDYYRTGEFTYSYAYDNVSKRMYDEYVNRPYITFRDSRRANYEYEPAEIFRDSVVQVLGMECFMVKKKSTYGSSTTYYSDEIKVDYQTFKDHQVGNWYNDLKEVDGCLSIKTITEYEDHYQIQEAVKITPMELGVKDFEVNTDKIIVASTSALDSPVDWNQPTQEAIDCYREKLKEARTYKEKKDEPQRIILSVVVNKKGELLYPQPYNDEYTNLNNIAIDIISNCGFTFKPGQIDGRDVSAIAYFPIDL